MPDAQGRYTIDDAIAATEERGPIVARVYCPKCHEGKPLGIVRSSSCGLVFDALIVGDAEEPWRKAAMFSRAHEAGKRLKFVSRGRCVVLLERDQTDADPANVACGKHGPMDIDQAGMLNEIRQNVASP